MHTHRQRSVKRRFDVPGQQVGVTARVIFGQPEGSARRRTKPCSRYLKPVGFSSLCRRLSDVSGLFFAPLHSSSFPCLSRRSYYGRRTRDLNVTTTALCLRLDRRLNYRTRQALINRTFTNIRVSHENDVIATPGTDGVFGNEFREEMGKLNYFSLWIRSKATVGLTVLSLRKSGH